MSGYAWNAMYAAAEQWCKSVTYFHVLGPFSAVCYCTHKSESSLYKFLKVPVHDSVCHVVGRYTKVVLECR
jgi:hypothetical protein